MTNSNTFDDITNSVTDNSILDPFQGYDADVWAIDQATGKWVLVGRFTSIELVFRNTTRPYIEFNQRVMRQLDGNFMIGWTMERGQLDSRVLQQTFGYSKISRSLRVNRHPRMQIVFQVNAPELDNRLNVETNRFSASASNLSTANSGVDPETNSDFNERDTKSLIVLTFCKVETFTLRAEAGDEVISNRWEGVAEGYEVLDQSNVWAGHYLDDSGAVDAASIITEIQSGTGFRTGNDDPNSRVPFS